MLIKNSTNKDLIISSKTMVNLSRDSYNMIWTHSKFKDELYIHLTRVKDPNKSASVTDIQRIYLNDYKYYSQARRLIYWVPICRPNDKIPPFLIYTDDLKSNPKLYAEFEEYITGATEKEIAFLLKEIAVKFFEAIDYFYAHNSVISHIVVGIA
jgi:hypothetical protein